MVEEVGSAQMPTLLLELLDLEQDGLLVPGKVSIDPGLGGRVNSA